MSVKKNNGSGNKQEVDETMPVAVATVTDPPAPAEVTGEAPEVLGTKGNGLNREKLGEILSHAAGSSIIHELLHPGDDPDKLWMRTVIRRCNREAESKLDAAIGFYDLCVHFHDEEGRLYILRKVAGWASIDGVAREQAVAASIGEMLRKARERDDHKNSPPKQVGGL